MCAGTEKARIVMDNEIHRNIMDIFFKAPFILKCGTEPSPAKVKRLVWKRHLSVLIWRRSDDL